MPLVYVFTEGMYTCEVSCFYVSTCDNYHLLGMGHVQSGRNV